MSRKPVPTPRDGLEEYRRKRRFDRTPEPQGSTSQTASGRRFVVQEHHARARHWDLRLEMDGVLRSWALPKGPSLDPADKRLAVLVEDHPIEYGDFEGVIPPGNYGAGTVMLWDRGTYECLEGEPSEAFQQGKLTLRFYGDKLRGEFHLVRTKRNGGRDWLLFKGRDEYAVAGYDPTGTRSVASGRTIEEIRADADARWAVGADPTPGPEPADPFPEPFPPMLAQPADEPFDRPGWWFEVKWDGIRALAFVRRRGAAQEVAVYNRSLRRINARFPEIVESLRRLPVTSVVLDGEIVATDEAGRPSFARLQQRMHLTAEPDVRHAMQAVPVFYVVFDCLYLDGHDLRAQPFARRRRALEGLSLPAGVLRADAVEQHGRALFEAARRHGFEGVVAKKADGPYQPGVRSPHWLKIKGKQTTEAAVAGFTRGKGHRAATLGALVLGQYDSAGRLVHIGQTGGGFTEADVRSLRRRLDALVAEACPFAEVPETAQPVTWVRPEVVVEVEHAGRTPDGKLRFPVFVRVRDDLRAADVRLPVGEEAVSDVRNGPSGRSRPVGRSPGASSRSQAAEWTSPRQIGALTFTNLDKVYFPELGLRKGDVIEYYRRIARYLLPHLRDRPLTLRRFPEGIHGEDFFQKDVADAPEFVRTERVWSDQGKRDIRVVICDNEETLLWLVQMGCIEMHAWFSRVAPIPGSSVATAFSGSEEALDRSVLNYPDFVVFDIDPFLFPEGKQPVRRHGEFDPDYSRAGFEAARRAALWLEEALSGLGLRSYAKTSGKTALHVFVPIERRHTYAETHAFAKTVAAWLVRRHPKELTVAWRVRDRVGKVFLDYNQNVRGKTLATVYSLRPVPPATVSVPVTWEELRRGFDPLQWTFRTVFDRIDRVGDLWSRILQSPQRIEISA
ncbi:MAG: non-homologous end-joining DNA ligase [Armatimonadota bacterium]|nr:non-homologous end-joining DNA ligase [Armatimonadota bacterium]MDR5697173.1 non-homologous end-joining DNA ligase [Armatimonadota bacterium]